MRQDRSLGISLGLKQIVYNDSHDTGSHDLWHVSIAFMKHFPMILIDIWWRKGEDFIEELDDDGATVYYSVDPQVHLSIFGWIKGLDGYIHEDEEEKDSTTNRYFTFVVNLFGF